MFLRVEVGYNTSTVALRVAEGDEKEPGAWKYNWATLSLGNINTGTWPSRFGLDARLMTLLCKEIIVVKSKEVKTGLFKTQEWANQTDSSKEGYGSKRAALPMMMMTTTMMMMM
jgi:hypothetical protein